MYKPYLEQRDFIGIEEASQRGEIPQDPTITGSMELDILEWKAKTYYSNGRSNKSFEHSTLMQETYKTYGILGSTKVVPEEFTDAYIEGLNICGQDGRVINDYGNLSHHYKAAYKDGLYKCGLNSPSKMNQSKFHLLSKGAKKKFLKGAKQSKKKLPEWVIVELSCC